MTIGSRSVQFHLALIHVLPVLLFCFLAHFALTRGRIRIKEASNDAICLNLNDDDRQRRPAVLAQSNPSISVFLSNLSAIYAVQAKDSISITSCPSINSSLRFMYPTIENPSSIHQRSRRSPTALAASICPAELQVDPCLEPRSPKLRIRVPP